ncbi:MAG: calcium/sodium antiporter [Bacteroidales bacterium]|nr:calcium/sodium antiporter [Bacteroidales bacterium]MDZ4205586.1 calcium/sodium antiporter [Bacteroidales bacterium]
MTYLILFAGFAFLILGAHWLVDGGRAIGKRLNIPDIVIGLTIVSIGTSAPEMVVSVIASAKGATDLAIANVIGSNIFNTLIIIGVAAVIYPISIKKDTLRWELPLSMFASVVLLLLARDYIPTGGKSLSVVRLDGVIFLLLFAGFLYYTYLTAKNHDRNDGDEIKIRSTAKSLLLISAGLVFLYAGGRMSVNGAVDVARQLGISEKTIGVTVVAVATSLPELVTSVVAAYKRNSDIAIGNALGSNIFNIWLVLGLSALISPLPFQSYMMPDLYVSILSNLVIMLFIIGISPAQRNINRPQGGILILLYFAYIAYVFWPA